MQQCTIINFESSPWVYRSTEFGVDCEVLATREILLGTIKVSSSLLLQLFFFLGCNHYNVRNVRVADGACVLDIRVITLDYEKSRPSLDYFVKRDRKLNAEEKYEREARVTRPQDFLRSCFFSRGCLSRTTDKAGKGPLAIY